jgi:hypothetical protein
MSDEALKTELAAMRARFRELRQSLASGSREDVEMTRLKCAMAVLVERFGAGEHFDSADARIPGHRLRALRGLTIHGYMLVSINRASSGTLWSLKRVDGAPSTPTPVPAK